MLELFLLILVKKRQIRRTEKGQFNHCTKDQEHSVHGIRDLKASQGVASYKKSNVCFPSWRLLAFHAIVK